MCNFLSMWVLKDGSILWSNTQNHGHIGIIHNVLDNEQEYLEELWDKGEAIRVEYGYRWDKGLCLRVDEPFLLYAKWEEWFTPEVERWVESIAKLIYHGLVSAHDDYIDGLDNMQHEIDLLYDEGLSTEAIEDIERHRITELGVIPGKKFEDWANSHDFGPLVRFVRFHPTYDNPDW